MFTEEDEFKEFEALSNPENHIIRDQVGAPDNVSIGSGSDKCTAGLYDSNPENILAQKKNVRIVTGKIGSRVKLSLSSYIDEDVHDQRLQYLLGKFDGAEGTIGEVITKDAKLEVLLDGFSGPIFVRVRFHFQNKHAF